MFPFLVKKIKEQHLFHERYLSNSLCIDCRSLGNVQTRTSFKCNGHSFVRRKSRTGTDEFFESPLASEETKYEKADAVLDEIRRKYGEESVGFARLLDKNEKKKKDEL